MRSGVGPAEHLRSVGIPVRVDLPGMGADLADHGGVDIDCGYRGPARAQPILHLAATFQSKFTASHEAPDPMLRLSDPRRSAALRARHRAPQSRGRGTVRLRSPDPAEPPLIALPDRCDPLDVERLAEGYRRGLAVACRPEIRNLCRDSPTLNPRDADELATLIRTDGYHLPHVVGTCSMGPRPEEGAVVNTFGDVNGTERLTVIDASIAPNGPSGFTHIPTVMIAERFSEQIGARL